MTEPEARSQLALGNVSSFVIMSGWSLLIMVCLLLILSVCYLALWRGGAPLDENLVKLAFAATGFLFGSFPSLLKDLLAKA